MYLGADSACLSAQADARKVGLAAGLYWSLAAADPEGQARLFVQRGEKFSNSTLPPAVYCYQDKHLDALKVFVEAVERETKKTMLIGGTPASLRRAGLVFGRSNPLWISHRPLAGGPTLPVGWSKFAVWQTILGQVKGVDIEVGCNGAQTNFIKPGPGGGAILAGGLGVALLAGAVYYVATKKEG